MIIMLFWNLLLQGKFFYTKICIINFNYNNSYYCVLFELRKSFKIIYINDIEFYRLDGFTYLNYIFGSAELKSNEKISQPNEVHNK